MDLNHIKQEQKKIEDKLLADFATKWGQRDGYRRFKILQEAIPRISKSLSDQGPKDIHPDHLEMYVNHLAGQIRSLLENCNSKLIKTFEKAPTHDTRVAMLIRCVNIITEKAEELQKQKTGVDESSTAQQPTEP